MSRRVDAADESGRRTGRLTAGGVLSRAVGRLVRNPQIAVPFVVAGVVVAAVDWLRLHDPIPTAVTPGLPEGTVSIAFYGYPSGVPASSLPFGALVDLKPAYLAWALGLEALAIGTVAVAGWLALSWALERTPTLGRLRSYLGLVVALRVALPLVGVFDGLGPVVGIVVLLLVFWVLVRLFAAPGFAITGDGPIRAMVRSTVGTAGRARTVAAVVLVLGLGGWLAGSVPVGGSVLSFALVAPVHAAAVAVIVEPPD